MNYTVNIDWKFVLALGTVPAWIILANKINPEAAERVLTQLANAYGSHMYAISSEC